MTSYSRGVRWAVWGFLGVVTVSIFVAYFVKRGKVPELPVYGQVGDFALTDQNGHKVSRATLQGNIWVANVIFTRCAGPCGRLTLQMQQLQRALPASAPVRFISLTADPGYDAPEVLQKYGERYHADDARWFFLTGEKSDVYSLAINGLKFTVLDNEGKLKPDEDLFVHSQKFVVVDRQGQIRAYIDGDEPETVKQLARAIEALLKERQK